MNPRKISGRVFNWTGLSETAGGILRSNLRKELTEAGLLESRPFATYLKSAFLFIVTVALLGEAMAASNWWLKVPLFLVGFVVSVSLVMIGHESGHGTISPRRLINDLPGYLAFPLMGGLSFGFWKQKHGAHHAHTNITGKDPDVIISVLAMTRAEQVKAVGPVRQMQKVQGYIFWPMTTLLGLGLRVESLQYIFGRGRRGGISREQWLDNACIAGHYLVWLIIPIFVFHIPATSVALFYAAWTVEVGVLLAAIFLPAHTPFPIYDAYTDNTHLQLETTQNLVTNRLFSWLLIGLDHQVEHHLFPRMSHMNLKIAAPIVRSHCLRSGMPYQEQSWFGALWSSTLRVHVGGNYDPVPQPARSIAPNS